MVMNSGAIYKYLRTHLKCFYISSAAFHYENTKQLVEKGTERSHHWQRFKTKYLLVKHFTNKKMYVILMNFICNKKICLYQYDKHYDQRKKDSL